MITDDFIKIENLSFDYEYEDEGSVIKRTALSDISFSIKRGSFTAIVGPNGSGKSTLAKNLNALYLPCGGHIYVDGMDTLTTDPIDIRKKVGMVFQNPDNQLVSSVVEDDIAFGPENIGLDPKIIRQRVDDALNKVSMSEHRSKSPHHLSGGQKQRVAIAGVIAMDTECIVFDEPTAMLDPKGREEIMDIIDELHREGKTVVLITHFMEEAARADRIIIINNTKLAFDASPKELFTEENAALLKDMNLTMPFAARMAADLRCGGLDIPQGILTEDELANALMQIKK